MVNNTVARYLKKQRQDSSCDESVLHLSLKMLHFAGIFPYEKICNTPRKLKLYLAYQIALYVIYCPIFFSQFVKLYLISQDLHEAIQTITHMVLGVGGYILPLCVNWNVVYHIICKIDMSMPTKRTTQIDRKTTEILRESRQTYKFFSLFFLILGTLLLICDLYDIFFLKFLENLVGVEHKYKKNPNATNMYESLLLEKFPFSCLTPFDEKSVTAHQAMYIYTTIPVLLLALKIGSCVSVACGMLLYISLQFKFVCKSLEVISYMEDSDSQIEQDIFTTLDEQHICEKFSNRNIQVSATDGESFQTPSQAQISECWNIHQYTDTSITTAHCVKDQEHKKVSYILPSDNKSSLEDCVITIIKNHQEAIW